MADERLRSMNKFSFENQKHSIHKILKNRYLNRENKSTCEYRNTIRNKNKCLCSHDMEVCMLILIAEKLEVQELKQKKQK